MIYRHLSCIDVDSLLAENYLLVQVVVKQTAQIVLKGVSLLRQSAEHIASLPRLTDLRQRLDYLNAVFLQILH